MEPTANMKDVARLAGVSRATVSNAINNPELVAESTRVRVQQAIADLAFVRNEPARQLRMGRSSTVGFIALDTSNPFFAEVGKGANKAAREHGSFLLTATSDGDHNQERSYLRLFGEQRVQGVLISPAGDVSEELRRLRAQGIPSVFVDSPSPTKEFSSVQTDNVAGGCLAVEHLLGAGRVSIGFVGGPLSLPQVADRLAGARKALRLHRRRPADMRVWTANASTEEEGRRLGRIIAALPHDARPDALFATNDLLAMGLLHAFVDDGHIRVPSDIAVVGYDDIGWASSAVVPLTSVRQPSELIGEVATQMLIEESENLATVVHEQLRFPPELVIRTSSTGEEIFSPAQLSTRGK